MTNDYVPIDCDQHSVLEVLAMRRTSVVAQFTLGEGPRVSAEGAVMDVLAREGAEYLILLDQAGQELSIRLDQLQGLSATDGEAIWRQKNVSN
jgi:transcriptional antiterminator Rof (Rho-off)